MEIREITTSDDKQRIARLILEALPDWFGIPEAREEYIEKSVKQPFFAAFDGENAVRFLSPCRKQGGIRRNSMSWAC